MLKSEAAAYLAGVTQTEGAEASAPTNLHIITGEVGETSENGKALVKIDGLVFSESDNQYIEIDALGGLEEGDIATLILAGEQGHGMTPLAIGSIGSVDRITVRIAAIEADYIKVEQLEAATARIGDLEADHVSTDDLEAAKARIGTLETTRATITELEAATARIHELEVDHVSIDDFEAEQANIDQLQANTADIGTIRANSAKVQNLTAAQLEADHATVGSLSTNYAHITNGVIDNATIGYADVDNLSAHYAEIQNGKIDSALINTAAIVDEQVFTVTGNKATLHQLDAAKINVLNLKAENIEVERINGQPVSGKTLVDALSQHESDISDLDSKIDDEVEALNERIDGAIETFTGTVVPTLNNTPASEWNTIALKDQHIGDVYYVVNNQSAQNGYCYRFTKSGSTYSWQLIKDSDVTAALSRLQTAEGKIGDIETFDETVGSFMTNTNDEISSLKTKDTQLETSLGDKVSTSTFNTVSQKVDVNEANITSMSTVLTNNGLTSSTNITNTVNTVSQTATGNSSKITQLTTTLGTNADGTTKTGDVMHRTSAVEQDVSSFKTTVAQTYATNTTVNGLATRVSTAESNITQNATDIALRVTKTEASQMAQPNLSPYFSACQNTDFFTNSNYPVISSELGTIGTQLSDGWLHVDMDNSARSAAAYLNTWLKKPSWAKNSTEYTWLIEVRNFTLTSGSYVRFSPAQGNSAAQTSVTGYMDVTANGSYYVKSTTKADATTNSAYTTFSRGLMQANAGVNASFDVRYSVYEGDYSDGPYKPYGGDGFYATSAELKVTNDAVSSKVSQTDYNGSTIASLINQSASTVQIEAQHIQLNGEVTFGAIRSYADAAYDAIGSADAVQVGGRNLLQRAWRVDDSGVKSGITYTCNADGSITLDGTSTAQHVFILAQSLTLSAGTYTLSGCPAGGGINAYRLDILTVPVSGGTTETKADNGNGVTFETPGGTTGQVRIRVVSGQTLSNLTFWPKLERGNRATDWSPAPEDITTALNGTNESLSDTNDRLETLDGNLTAATIATGVSLNNIRKSITSLQGSLNGEIDARQQWLNFKTSEGLTIGEDGGTFRTVITSTSMEFKNGGTTLASTSGSEFEAPVMSVTNELHMGGWMWTNRANGNLSLKWIG